MVSSGPLFRHDDGADHGYEQQNRSNLEREQIRFKEAFGYRFRIERKLVHGCGGEHGYSLAGHFAGGPKHEAHLRGERKRDEECDPFLPCELQLAHGDIQIHQHDYENEQYHDAADVKNDLYDEEEFRAELEEDSGGGEECGNQKNRAVDDVAARDRQDRADDGDRGEQVKDDLIKHRNPARRRWLSAARSFAPWPK